MKKAVKKVKKQQTITKKTKNEITELRKLAYIFGSLVLIFLIFYGIAYLKLSNKENKKEEVVKYIQYEEILINNILNQNKNEYYVLMYNNKEDYEKYYFYYVKKYSSKENTLFTYLIDINNSFNSMYKNDTSNLNVTNINELKVKEDALLKISNGTIVEVHEGMDNISNYLNNL